MIMMTGLVLLGGFDLRQAYFRKYVESFVGFLEMLPPE